LVQEGLVSRPKAKQSYFRGYNAYFGMAAVYEPPVPIEELASMIENTPAIVDEIKEIFK